MARENPKLQLLIVDDHRPFLRALARLHVRSGRTDLALRTAGSLEEAVAALDEAPADVVLFDLCMPTLEHALALLEAVFERAPLPRLLGMSGQTLGADGFGNITELGKLGVRTVYDKGTSQAGAPPSSIGS